MEISPQEHAILDVFCRHHPRPRFQQIAGARLGAAERAAATKRLVDKGVLARLADGEYWLTERGVLLLTHYC